MIKLVKNELTKVFHKKVVYVMMIVIALANLATFLLYRLVDNISFDEGTIEEVDKKDYDLENEEELSWYLGDKTLYDVTMLEKEYGEDSWKGYVIQNDLYDSIYCINRSEVVSDEDGTFCQKQYDATIEALNADDWKDYAILKKEKLVQELDEFNSFNSSEFDSMQKSLELEIEALDYRIKNDVPFSSDPDYYNEYVSYGIVYFQKVNHKDDLSYQELEDFKDVEKNYFEAKYKMEHNIRVTDMFEVGPMLASESKAVIFLVLVATIIVAGSIVAEEFNKGTIKQLLLRPFSRIKILYSKYITVLIIFLCFLLFNLFTSTIFYGFVKGFSSLSVPMVIYDLSIGKIVEMSLFKYIFINFIAVLPNYLILITLAFTLGVLFSNTAVAIAVTIMANFFAGIVDLFASGYEIKLLSLLPSSCWNLTSFLYGGSGINKYSNFGVALVIDILCLVIMLILTTIIFKKKNIKNQ